MHTITLPVLAMLFQTGLAAAFPLCDTGTGQQVRAGIFDGSFGYNLLIGRQDASANDTTPPR